MKDWGQYIFDSEYLIVNLKFVTNIGLTIYRYQAKVYGSYIQAKHIDFKVSYKKTAKNNNSKWIECFEILYSPLSKQ